MRKALETKMVRQTHERGGLNGSSLRYAGGRAECYVVRITQGIGGNLRQTFRQVLLATDDGAAKTFVVIWRM